MQEIELQGGKMPSFGFGTWMLNGQECIEAVGTALDVGYRHIDTAQFYENEAEIGDAIAAYNVSRDNLFITTKVIPTFFADKDEAVASVNESLQKLQTDYVDLLLIHWPISGVAVSDMIEQMMEIKKQGKTRNIGVSNFNVKQMEEAIKVAGAEISCNQVEYHPYLSQQPVLDFARQHKIAVTAYCPLARQQLLDETALKEIGLKHGKTSAQVALRWLVQQDDVAAIPKSSNPERIKSNFEIFDFELSDDEMKAIHGLARSGSRIVDFGRSDWDQAC